LVDAYLARRALDYLVGFTLSPILWRKLPGSRSAGRVQSVALRLVCDRESEIERFVREEFWQVAAILDTPRREKFEARLTAFEGKRLQKLDISSNAQADDIKAMLEGASFKALSVEAKPTKRNPGPPFTTSTLQQSASSQLGFSAVRTMQVAQRLYEGMDIGGETAGLITYMRTDGVQMAPEALTEARKAIVKEFGDKYLPEKPRYYSAKAKNAQEAHEAIRPTDFSRTPNEMRKYLDADQARLYEMIWKRAIASQMQPAEIERTTVEIEARNGAMEGTLVPHPSPDESRQAGDRLVKSAARTLELLEALATGPSRQSLRELGQTLGVPKSSMYALLRTMPRHGEGSKLQGVIKGCRSLTVRNGLSLCASLPRQLLGSMALLRERSQSRPRAY
jgi:DNA topoisomerase-1